MVRRGQVSAHRQDLVTAAGILRAGIGKSLPWP
jgi:hypothetical protein